MAITQIRLDTQAQDATLVPSKISANATDDFSFPRDVTATRNVKIGDGSASLPSLTFVSDPNTGLFNQAADSVGIAAGGTEYLRINPSRTQAFNHIRTTSGGSASSPDIEVGSATTGIFNGTGGSDFNITVGSSTKLSNNSVQWESFSPFRFTAGSAGVASMSFTGDPDTGTFSPGANIWAVTTGGVETIRVDTTGLKAINGTAANPALSFTGDPDTGFFDQAANSLGIAAGGSEKARIDVNGIKTVNGSVANPSYSFINDPDTGFAINGTFGSNSIDIVMGGAAGFTFNREGVTTNYQLFSQVAGIATRPVYSTWGSSTTGIYFPSGNVGVSVSGVETVEFGSSEAHFIANDVRIDDNQKVVLGNSGNAFLKYDSTIGSVVVSLDGTNGEIVATAGLGFAANASADYEPFLGLGTDGTGRIQLYSTTPGADGTRLLDMGFENGITSGFHPAVRVSKGNPNGDVYLEMGYDADGLARTGSRIRGANLTVESLSPLYLVADSVNVSSKVLNADGALATPAYAFSSDATTGIYRGAIPELGIAVSGAGIMEFRTTMVRVHQPLQMNSHEINTVSLLKVADGSASAPSYTFDSDATTGLFHSGVFLQVASNGTEVVRFGDSGIEVQPSIPLKNSDGSAANPSYTFVSNEGHGFYYVDLNTIGVSVNGVHQFDMTNNGIELVTGKYIFADGTGPNGASYTLGDASTGFSGDSAAGTYIGMRILGSEIARLTATSLNMNSHKIINVTDPTLAQDAATKNYVDTNFVNKDGSVVMTGNLDLGNNRIVNVADPIGDQDAATKSYVDSVAAGLDPKASSRVATTTTLTLTTDYTRAGTGGTHTLTSTANAVLDIDGVNTGWVDIDNDGGSRDPMAATPASRVLVKNASDPKDNGIYAVKDKGSVSTPWILIRATDQDGTPSNEVSGGNFTFVEEGTLNADTGWTVSANGNIVVDTDNIDWIQFSAAGAINAGTGLSQSGATIDFNAADASLTVNADDVAVHRDVAGALGLTGAGIKVNVDGSTLEIASNNVQVKDAGITYAKTNLVTRETPSGTVDGVNAVFTLANSCAAGSEHVFLNGILQDVGGANDYTISGSTITFNVAPVSGSKIRVTYWMA